MKKFNLQQALFDNGLIEKGNLEEIEAFKKRYAKKIKKQQNRNYKENTHRKRLTFTSKEVEHINDLTKQYQMPSATLIKASFFAYHQGSIIHPNQPVLTSIEQLLREINARIAESIQYVHLSEEVSLKDIERLKKSFFELEKFIAKTIHQPPRLDVWVDKHQEKDPLFVSKLLEQIARYLPQAQ